MRSAGVRTRYSRKANQQGTVIALRTRNGKAIERYTRNGKRNLGIISADRWLRRRRPGGCRGTLFRAPRIRLIIRALRERYSAPCHQWRAGGYKRLILQNKPAATARSSLCLHQARTFR